LPLRGPVSDGGPDRIAPTGSQIPGGNFQSFHTRSVESGARHGRLTPFLKGKRFDPETTRVLGVALELMCIAVRAGDCADDVKQAIADKLIALAKTGEHNRDLLCEKVLRDIRGQV